MIHIHITRMVDINTLRSVMIDAIFQELNQIKTIQRIQAVIWKIEELHTRCTTD